MAQLLINAVIGQVNSAAGVQIKCNLDDKSCGMYEMVRTHLRRWKRSAETATFPLGTGTQNTRRTRRYKGEEERVSFGFAQDQFRRATTKAKKQRAVYPQASTEIL